MATSLHMASAFAGSIKASAPSACFEPKNWTGSSSSIVCFAMCSFTNVHISATSNSASTPRVSNSDAVGTCLDIGGSSSSGSRSDSCSGFDSCSNFGWDGSLCTGFCKAANELSGITRTGGFVFTLMHRAAANARPSAASGRKLATTRGTSSISSSALDASTPGCESGVYFSSDGRCLASPAAAR